MAGGNIDGDDGGKGSFDDDFGAEAKSLSAEDDSGSKGSKLTDKKSSFPMVAVLCSAVLFLLLAAVALYFVRARMSAKPLPVADKVKSAITIVRPIPQLETREMLDFLIVYKVQGGEMVTALRMEAVFGSLLRYGNFKKNTVVFRDTVYNFLLRQDSAGNSEKSWHSVLGKNLLDYLRVRLPESCPDNIRLTQVENR
ncbi:MAG: hypothetical protein P4L43_18575 [Syntrophobacteraceae bacterium]|nr:hypothetical protein [Syntrophobacteraceae bacterium]